MFSTLLTHHDGWGDGPGPWALIPLSFFLLWLSVIVFAVVRFRRGGPPWARHGGRSVLDERFARGEITADEYRERRAVLTGAGPMNAPANATAPTRTAAARVVDATKVYGVGRHRGRALDDVTVDLPAGRFTAVMGPSGSGKSTLHALRRRPRHPHRRARARSATSTSARCPTRSSRCCGATASASCSRRSTWCRR